MSGHSHWATIKHKKGAIDAKRGKLFSKLSRAIIIAAKHGGGDPETNLKLRYAIDKAREASVPKDNIERAIKRGTGEGNTEVFEEIVYEGFGPGGVAILVDILTDNRNRTNGEVRKIFERGGGNMGGAGCVGYLFERKGVIVVDATTIAEDKLLELALEAGAEDLRRSAGVFEVICEASTMAAVRQGLEAGGVPVASSDFMAVPKSTIEVDTETGKKVLKLLDAIDDHDDVQSVYSNAALTEAMMAE